MLGEELLARLQRTLQDHATGVKMQSVSAIVRSMEDQYGATATGEGRLLRDLLHGSAAWELFERPLPGAAGKRLPRAPDLSRCESVIQVMRESGELAEREHLLRMRDSQLRIAGAAPVSETERLQAVRRLYDGYFTAVMLLARRYQPLYQEMRSAVGAIPPLIGSGVQSRPLLQPPMMTQFFQLCHAASGAADTPPHENDQSHVLCDSRSRRNSVRITAKTDSLPLLDESAWDIAAIAGCAFFARTSGNDPEAAFPLLIDDYFEWRGIDPRKRTPELRREIDSRIRLLCEPARLHFAVSTELWLPDEETGRRAPTLLSTEGSFLVRRSGLYRASPWRTEIENEPFFGHLVALGAWAHPFLAARAMIGIFPRRLARYDRGRQQWERRIGWYLTFQMQNQSARMTVRKLDVAASGELRATVIPQHALRMRTVLEGSRAQWQEMARANPGKVMRQWADTLEALRRDGIIGEYTCLDGSSDGTDLPIRNRLSTMLERRYQFTPGGDLARRLHRKAERRK